MEKKVLDFIEQKNILSGTSRIVLAVSGGADSMAMAHFMLEHFPQYHFVIAHVNHGLRAEATEEELFVKAFAKEHGVEFCCHHADIAAIAKERKQGIEEIGREERYRFFRSLGADRILTAHHKDDDVETILFHMIRGCGMNGLSGIEPLHGDIGRPLLCVTKMEILAYCEKYGICYKTDCSNEDTVFTRNRIRKEVIPLLEKINPNVTDAICRLSKAASMDNEYLDAVAWKQYCRYSVEGDGCCRLQITKMFEDEPAIARRMVRMAVDACGVSVDYDGTQRICSLRNGKCMPIAKGLWVYRENDVLVFEPKRDPILPMEEVILPCLGKKEIGNLIIETKMPEKDDTCSVFDCGIFCSDFDDSPVVRTRRRGDYVVLPDGKRKKLSDYFVDEKIPASERDAVLLLADGARILWVVGYRFFAKPGEENLIVKIKVKS